MQQEKKAGRTEDVTSGNCQKSAFTLASQRLMLKFAYGEDHTGYSGKVTEARMKRRISHFFSMWLKSNIDCAIRHDGILTTGGVEVYRADIKAMDDYRCTHLPVHLLMQVIDYDRLEDATKCNPCVHSNMTMMLLEYEVARQIGHSCHRKVI
jgi:hypothetical protein